MGRIGMLEVVVLIVVALVVFGPKRLPELGRAAGNGIREFRSALNSIEGKGPAKEPTKEPIVPEFVENIPAYEDEKDANRT